jgi:hypothetical protein
MVPRVEHGLVVAWITGLVAGAVVLLSEVAWAGFLFAPGQAGATRWMGAIVVAHLVFTAVASALTRLAPIPWRPIDGPRTLYGSDASPPAWSRTYAGIALAMGVLRLLPEYLLGAAPVATVHDGGLIMLTSAALWSWVVWVRRFELFPLTARSRGSLRFASGGVMFVERQGEMDLRRIFGLRETAWDPRDLSAEEEPGEHQGPYRAAEEVPVAPKNRVNEVRPGHTLVLPCASSHWVWVGLATACAVLVSKAADLGMGYVFVVAGLLLGFVNRGSSKDAFRLRSWNWKARRTSYRGFVAFGLAVWSFFLMFVGIAEHRGAMASWSVVSAAVQAFETLTVAVLCWIPFWLDFAEARIFLRFREGHLQIRRAGLWLPLTDAVSYAGALGLETRPSRVWVEPRLFGDRWSQSEHLARDMAPYVVAWAPRVDRGTPAAATVDDGPSPVRILDSPSRLASLEEEETLENETRKKREELTR